MTPEESEQIFFFALYLLIGLSFWRWFDAIEMRKPVPYDTFPAIFRLATIRKLIAATTMVCWLPVIIYITAEFLWKEMRLSYRARRRFR
jgi:hypothetical protein